MNRLSEQKHPQDNKEFDDKIDFRDLFAVLWFNKNFIAIFTTFSLLVSIFISLSLTNIYTVQTLLSPSTSSNSSDLISRYGSFATLAGINLPENPRKNDVAIALSIAKSKKLLEKLMLNKTFLPDLMAAKSWNMETNAIQYDESIYDKKKNEWIRDVKLPFKESPSSQEALIEFSKLVSISQDKKTNLVTLTVSHLSPVVAYQWSLWIVKEINAILANMEIVSSQASIEYLNNQIKVTPYTELKTMFYQLIQESTQRMMLAEVNPEYVLTTIDPPVIPEVKSYPNRISMIFFGTLLGCALSILIIIFWKYIFGKDGELDLFQLRRRFYNSFGG